LFSVAEEKVGATGSTEVAYEDVLGTEAEGQELGAIGLFEVEVDVFGWGLVAGGHHVEPLDRIGFVAGAEFVEPVGGVGELGKELSGNFGPDFIAAAADGWADGGEEVGGVGAEVHLHLADGFDGDSGQGAAPTGVDSGYRTFSRVNEEDGDAVGGLDAEEEAGAVGDGGVAFAGLVGGGVEDMDYVGVDLFERDECQVGRVKSGLKASAVFEDVFAGVPVGEAEVEDFFAVKIGDSTGFGAEAMEEPGEFG
jgi:hypothetical protein